MSHIFATLAMAAIAYELKHSFRWVRSLPHSDGTSPTEANCADTNLSADNEIDNQAIDT